jgi:hypothetical protein
MTTNADSSAATLRPDHVPQRRRCHRVGQVPGLAGKHLHAGQAGRCFRSGLVIGHQGIDARRQAGRLRVGEENRLLADYRADGADDHGALAAARRQHRHLVADGRGAGDDDLARGGGGVTTDEVVRGEPGRRPPVAKRGLRRAAALDLGEEAPVGDGGRQSRDDRGGNVGLLGERDGVEVAVAVEHLHFRVGADDEGGRGEPLRFLVGVPLVRGGKDEGHRGDDRHPERERGERARERRPAGTEGGEGHAQHDFTTSSWVIRAAAVSAVGCGSVPAILPSARKTTWSA